MRILLPHATQATAAAVACIVLLPIADAVAVAQATATHVAAGYEHTCAVLSDGRVQCWGDNSFGQLGDGTNFDRLIPVAVAGPPFRASAVTAGGEHSCALTVEGEVKCWGRNSSGQLGDGTVTERRSPVDVAGLPPDIRAITAGNWHTCALGGNGAVHCWGFNEYRQLGDASGNRSFPAPVAGLPPDNMTIAAGDKTSAALTRNGTAMFWGFIGGTSECRFWPGPPPGTVCTFTPVLDERPSNAPRQPDGVVALAAGRFGKDNVCGITVAGDHLCWWVIEPPDSPPRGNWMAPTGVRSLAIGRHHDCAIDGAGACASGTQPLYPLYNRNRGGAPNHRYTTRPETRTAMIAQGWQAEGYGIGVIGCTPAP